MNTFVIGLLNHSGFAPHLSHIPLNSISGDKRVIVHNTPDITTFDFQASENRIVTNFDHLVWNGFGNSDFKLVPDHQQTLLEYRSKHQQAILLQRELDRYIEQNPNEETAKLRFPKTILLDQSSTHNRIKNIGGKVVLKPNTGARSIGQVLFDISIEDPLDCINKLKIKQNQISREANTAEAVKECSPGIIDYSKGREFSKNEGLSRLLNEEVVAQEYIQHVVEEYRFIIVGGEVVYRQKRRREGDIYKVADGSGEFYQDNGNVSFHEDLEKYEVPFKVRVILNDIIGKLIPDIGSVDIFLTNFGEIGIFEYSYEFGTTGIPTTHLESIYQKFVKHLIAKTQK